MTTSQIAQLLFLIKTCSYVASNLNILRTAGFRTRSSAVFPEQSLMLLSASYKRNRISTQCSCPAAEQRWRAGKRKDHLYRKMVGQFMIFTQQKSHDFYPTRNLAWNGKKKSLKNQMPRTRVIYFVSPLHID